MSSGTSSGGTDQSCSPRTLSASRLVANTRTLGHAASIALTRVATGTQHVLTVVEHDEQLLLSQIRDQ